MKLAGLTDEALHDHCAKIRPGIERLTSESPVATIGFPAHNEEDYLLPSLQHLAALDTRHPVMFIAANNASADRTKEILTACGVTVLDEDRKGTSYARQALVEAAVGDVLIQTDADTKVPPTWIEAHMRHYQNPNTAGVSGGLYSENYHPLWKVYRKANMIAHRVSDAIHKNNIHHTPGANFSAKIEDLKTIGGYTPNFNEGEDSLIAHRLKQTGHILIDHSREISVDTDGRRFMTTEQVMTHFRRRLVDSDYWKKIIFGQKEADVVPKDFKDFR